MHETREWLVSEIEPVTDSEIEWEKRNPMVMIIMMTKHSKEIWSVRLLSRKALGSTQRVRPMIAGLKQKSVLR